MAPVRTFANDPVTLPCRSDGRSGAHSAPRSTRAAYGAASGCVRERTVKMARARAVAIAGRRLSRAGGDGTG